MAEQTGQRVEDTAGTSSQPHIPPLFSPIIAPLPTIPSPQHPSTYHPFPPHTIPHSPPFPQPHLHHNPPPLHNTHPDPPTHQYHPPQPEIVADYEEPMYPSFYQPRHPERLVNAYDQPKIHNRYLSIEIADDVNEGIKISPSLISMMQQGDRFSGGADENPHAHLQSFLMLCESLKTRGIDDGILKMRLFPYYLIRRARQWILNMPSRSFTTWESLANGFLKQLFLPHKTTRLVEHTLNFSQQGGETLHEAWERFRDLQRQCPHYGLEEPKLLRSFFFGLLPEDRKFVDAAGRGGILELPMGEAFDIMERLSRNCCEAQGITERNYSKSVQAVASSNGMRVVNARLDILQRSQEMLLKRFDAMMLAKEAKPTSTYDDIRQMKAIEGPPSTHEDICYAYYDASKPLPPTYQPGLRNHPNFSYIPIDGTPAQQTIVPYLSARVEESP